MADETARRCGGGGRFTGHGPPEMVFEVRIAEGTEAAELRLEQARVLREVVEWIAQRRSGPGPDHAA